MKERKLKSREKREDMFTVIFMAALIWLVWKMLVLGLKATWGIAKFVCAVLLLPVFLIGLVCVGLIYVAVPILVIAGLIAFFCGHAHE